MVQSSQSPFFLESWRLGHEPFADKILDRMIAKFFTECVFQESKLVSHMVKVWNYWQSAPEEYTSFPPVFVLLELLYMKKHSKRYSTLSSFHFVVN